MATEDLKLSDTEYKDDWDPNDYDKVRCAVTDPQRGTGKAGLPRVHRALWVAALAPLSATLRAAQLLLCTHVCRCIYGSCLILVLNTLLHDCLATAAAAAALPQARLLTRPSLPALASRRSHVSLSPRRRTLPTSLS